MIENALGTFHSDFLPSPPLWDPKCIFLGFSLWEPGGMFGSKTHEHMVNPVDCELLEFSHSHANPHPTINNSSNLPLKCSCQLPQQFLFQVSRSWMCLWMSLCMQIVGWKTYRFRSFLVLRKVIDFKFVKLFLFIRTSVTTSKLCTCWSWKGRLLLLFLLPLLSQLLH